MLKTIKKWHMFYHYLLFSFQIGITDKRERLLVIVGKLVKSPEDAVYFQVIYYIFNNTQSNNYYYYVQHAKAGE